MAESQAYSNENNMRIDYPSHVYLNFSEIYLEKRKAASVEKLVRDGWWPAMVIQVTETKVSKKIDPLF